LKEKEDRNDKERSEEEPEKNQEEIKEGTPFVYLLLV